MSESLNLTTQTENSIEEPDTHSNGRLGIDQTIYEHVIDPSLILIQQISAVLQFLMRRFSHDLNPVIPHRSTMTFILQSVHT